MEYHNYAKRPGKAAQKRKNEKTVAAAIKEPSSKRRNTVNSIHLQHIASTSSGTPTACVTQSNLRSVEAGSTSDRPKRKTARRNVRRREFFGVPFHPDEDPENQHEPEPEPEIFGIAPGFFDPRLSLNEALERFLPAICKELDPEN